MTSQGTCIAVGSGKGGTGKTSFVSGVGTALAQSGRRVLCLDCDIGLRNLDLALGLSDRALMDFSDVAQCCKNYGEYIGKAAQADENEWRYFGIGLCGPKKLVSKLTGSMPLLR